MNDSIFYELRLAQTHDYDPRDLEHWLHRVQHASTPFEMELQTHDEKLRWITSADWSPWLYGARAQKISLKKNTGLRKHHKETEKKYYLRPSKTPLLPIKRYSQFENITLKTRIAPMDDLLHELSKDPKAWVKIKIRALSTHHREWVLKKAKRTWFDIERRWDQWESQKWFTWGFRRWIGPLIRIGLSRQTTPSHADEKTQSKHERESAQEAMLDKLARPLFRVELESNRDLSSFAHAFELPYLGGITCSEEKSELILSAEELASLLAFPHTHDKPHQLLRESSVYLPCPIKNPLEWDWEDRKRHVYLVGKTGMGKSTLLLHLFKQDIERESGIVLIDPHGDLVADALALIPPSESHRVLSIDPSDPEFCLALNPVEASETQNSSLQASALVDMFGALAQGSWGPRLEYILRNTLLLLIESENTTLLNLSEWLTQSNVIREKIGQCKNPEVKRFFEQEFLAWDEKTRHEYIAPILNKIGPLLSTPLLRNIFAQPKSKFNMEKLLNERSILLVNLAKGKVGEDASRLLGMIFLSMIQAALLRRAALTEKERQPVSVVVDEFQNFTTRSLISMLSELRKYGLALTLANQYLTQNPPEIQEAVLGNVGSLFCFRTSYSDAQMLAPSLGLTENDLTQLSPFQSYVKRLHKNELIPLFRMDLPPPTRLTNPANPKEILDRSRASLSRTRKTVEEKTLLWYNKRSSGSSHHAKSP